MSYRTERKHKQSQRDAYADYLCGQNREQEAYFDAQPPLTDAERRQLEDWHRDRLQDEGRMR